MGQDWFKKRKTEIEGREKWVEIGLRREKRKLKGWRKIGRTKNREQED